MATSRDTDAIDIQFHNDQTVIELSTIRDTADVCELPEGKHYHLFFCHSWDDKDFVREKIKTLESPPFNLKCCVDDRDFIPGRAIIGNISNCIEQSLKTVLVLSPSFLDSSYCQFEQMLAQHKGLEERKNYVIPLILKPCNLPDSIKIYNHIDANNEDVDGEIVRALLSKENDPFVLPNQTRMRISSDEDISDENFRKIQDLGCKIDRRSLRAALKHINTHWILRYRGCQPCTSCHGCCLYLFGMMLVFIITGVICAAYDVDDRVLALSLLAVFGGYSFIIFPVICCFVPGSACRQRLPILQKAVSKRNVREYRATKTLLDFQPNPNPRIDVIFYDTEDCEKVIRQHILQKLTEGIESSTDTHKMTPHQHSQIQARLAMDRLVSVSSAFTNPNSSVFRATPDSHQTATNSMCFCKAYMSGKNVFVT